MKLDEYQQMAVTTAVYPDEFAVAYPALGLVEEVGELLDADDTDADGIVKEMGDVCWYCAALAYDLGLTLQSCYQDAKIQAIPDIEALYRNSYCVAGRVKKILRGDKDYDAKVFQVQGYIGDILRRIEAITSQYDSSLEEVCDRNIDKLFDRKERGVLKGDGDNR